MRSVLAICLLVLSVTSAMAQNKTAGRIGIWSNTPTPNSLTDIGNATTPGNLTVTGDLNVVGVTINTSQIKNVISDCGAKGDDLADDTTSIQNCINSLPVTGGTVLFPAGRTFRTTAPLTLGNGSSAAGSTRQGMVLIGTGNPAGIGQYGPLLSGTPHIDYQGSVWPGAIWIKGPLQGWGLQNLNITCAIVLNNIGVRIDSGMFGDSRNLRISGCQYGILSDVVRPAPPGWSVVDAIHNKWYGTAIELTAPGVGITLDGDAQLGDTDFNEFIDTTIWFKSLASDPGYSRYGIVMRVCDDNHFLNTHFTAWGNGYQIIPVLFDYTGPGPLGAHFPSGNVLDTIDPAQLGDLTYGYNSFQNAGAPQLGSQPNFLTHLLWTNGAKSPLTLPGLLVDTGADVWQPQVSGTTVAGSPTYIEQWGDMAQNGISTRVTASVNISDGGGATGYIVLRALPVRAANTTTASVCMVGPWGGFQLDTGYSSITAVVQQDTDQAVLMETGVGGNGQALTWGHNVTGGFYITMSCEYSRQ